MGIGEKLLLPPLEPANSSIVGQLSEQRDRKRSMAFPQEDFDLVLVPMGLLLMLAYNLFFLYRYLHFPRTTVMGVENDDKRAWVEAILQGNVDDRAIGVSVVAANVSAATFFASVCLTLCSLLGAWIVNSPSSSNIFHAILLLGDPKPSTASIKHLCLLLCFLVSFTCFVQSARHHVHASYLITTPGSLVDSEDVKVVVIRGGEFGSLGHRSLYFALSLLLWFFGPVPMFASSVILVMILHHHDTHSIPLKRRPVRKKTQIADRV